MFYNMIVRLSYIEKQLNLFGNRILVKKHFSFWINPFSNNHLVKQIRIILVLLWFIEQIVNKRFAIIVSRKPECWKIYLMNFFFWEKRKKKRKEKCFFLLALFVNPSFCVDPFVLLIRSGTKMSSTYDNPLLPARHPSYSKSQIT